ncbi:hypothetical protein T4D_15512 [Trichinella pseudospiralis]|uniref:Uncharacterized protein n=1 Tax=Trichinella pseudospiralis TaxID=6337 RepID=A0A0V1F4R6_TRIPS|nr:hypothetical protein T4D_15512 [Trichinella pseudospiralis]
MVHKFDNICLTKCEQQVVTDQEFIHAFIELNISSSKIFLSDFLVSISERTKVNNDYTIKPRQDYTRHDNAQTHKHQSQLLLRHYRVIFLDENDLGGRGYSAKVIGRFRGTVTLPSYWNTLHKL